MSLNYPHLPPDMMIIPHCFELSMPRIYFRWSSTVFIYLSEVELLWKGNRDTFYGEHIAKYVRFSGPTDRTELGWSKKKYRSGKLHPVRANTREQVLADT